MELEHNGFRTIKGGMAANTTTTTEAAIVFPLLPGKRDALAWFLDALVGPWRAEHDLSHQHVVQESWFLQPTPQGDIVIVYLEAPDPTEIFAELAVSQTAFALWFRAQVLELTGVDLALLPPFCLPERIFQRQRATSADPSAPTQLNISERDWEATMAEIQNVFTRCAVPQQEQEELHQVLRLARQAMQSTKHA